jgi:hypothetical protein
VLSRIHSFILIGIDPLLCEVECDVSNSGLDRTIVTGLPQHAVLINLAPADVKKEAPSLDLPIAIGLLRGSNFVQTDNHKNYLIAGELALDGRVRKIKGALSLKLTTFLYACSGRAVATLTRRLGRTPKTEPLHDDIVAPDHFPDRAVEALADAIVAKPELFVATSASVTRPSR